MNCAVPHLLNASQPKKKEQTPPDCSSSDRRVSGSTQGGPEYFPRDGSRRRVRVRSGSRRTRDRLRLGAQSIVDSLRSGRFRNRLRLGNGVEEEAVEGVGLDRSLVALVAFGVGGSVGARDGVLAVVTVVAVAAVFVVVVAVVVGVVGGRLVVEISLDDEDRSREHG